MSSGNINTTRNNFGNIRSHFQHRYSGVPSGENQNTSHHQEKKTYSLTQKSITNFFRSRSKRSGSSGGSKAAGDGGKEDDDEEEMINYGPEGNSMMTFKDITTFGYKQGDKFGVSSDTTPIIPTVMTTSQVKNMNNTEYRKYMTTQKKLALSAAARQQQQQNPQVLGSEGPRTMSLQNNYTRSPYGGMNSNMGGPVMNNGPGNIPGPAGGATGFPGNMQMRNQQPWGQAPPMQQQQQQQPQQQQHYGRPVDPRYRTMSLQGPGPAYGQLNQRRPGPGMVAHGTVNSNENRNQWASSQPQFQQQQQQYQGIMPGNVNTAQAQEAFGVGNRSPYEASSYRHSTNALPSYGNVSGASANTAAAGGGGPTNTPTSMAGGRSSAMGNVDTSAPYQQRAPALARQQQSQTELARPAGKLNVLQLSTQQQQELEQRAQTDSLKGNDQSTIDLRPRSVLESGLQALSLDDSNHTSLTTTSASGFNEISEVKERGTPQGNIHKMGNASDSSEFVTASDLQDNNRNNLDASSSRLNHESKLSSEPNTAPRPAGENSCANPKNGEVNGTGTPRIVRHSQTSNSSTGDVQLELSEISGTVDDTFGYKTSKVGDKQTSPSRDGIQNGGTPATNGGVANKLSGNNVNDDRGGAEDEFNFDNTVVMTYTDSLGRDIKGLSITGERLGLLNENRSLMQDLTLVSMELAESLKRETLLSEQLRNSNVSNSSYEKKNQVSLTDFSEELRKKSSKIVELIQALNEERLKRFIAEEQVLLQEVNAKPNSLEFMGEIQALKTAVKEKEGDIAKLKEELEAARR